MLTRDCCFRFLMALAISIAATTSFAAATVKYEGYQFGGLVIAGTFKPGFEASHYNITCTYGDEVCNLNNHYFDAAVSDGNIIPIGDFVGVNTNGYFSGSGLTEAAEGTRIYLFGFPYDPSFGGGASVLATSTDSSFLVPGMGGSTNVNANLANQFIFGQSIGGVLAFGGLPIPEPSTLMLLFCALAPLAVARRR